jgi:hypothetical protein
MDYLEEMPEVLWRDLGNRGSKAIFHLFRVCQLVNFNEAQDVSLTVADDDRKHD